MIDERHGAPVRLRFVALHAVLSSLVMGAITAVVWLLIGGREASQGSVSDVVRDRGLVLYGLIMVASALLGYLAERGPWRRWPPWALWIVILVAWLLEGAILVVFGRPLVADELHPIMAVIAWVVATGAGLQPLSVAAGVWLGRRRPSPAPDSN